MDRRTWLTAATSWLTLAMLAPVRALAGMWNKTAFESPSMKDALQGLGALQVGPSRDIVLVAPDLAENGAIVQIEVESRIAGTEAIAILVEKNPTPLIGNFMFSNGAEPYIVTRIKMAETSELRAIVKADGRYYSASRTIEVAQGGCG
jgi:sulfur-oxidizing protein SoxY